MTTLTKTQGTVNYADCVDEIENIKEASEKFDELDVLFGKLDKFFLKSPYVTPENIGVKTYDIYENIACSVLNKYESNYMLSMEGVHLYSQDFDDSDNQNQVMLDFLKYLSGSEINADEYENYNFREVLVVDTTTLKVKVVKPVITIELNSEEL